MAFDNIGNSTNAGLTAALEGYRLSMTASNAEKSDLRAMRDAVERAKFNEAIAENMRDIAVRNGSRILESYKQRYADAVSARKNAEKDLEAKLNELKRKYREPGPRGSNAGAGAAAGAGSAAGAGAAPPGFFEPAPMPRRMVAKGAAEPPTRKPVLVNFSDNVSPVVPAEGSHQEMPSHSVGGMRRNRSKSRSKKRNATTTRKALKARKTQRRK